MDFRGDLRTIEVHKIKFADTSQDYILKLVDKDTVADLTYPTNLPNFIYTDHFWGNSETPVEELPDVVSFIHNCSVMAQLKGINSLILDTII